MVPVLQEWDRYYSLASIRPSPKVLLKTYVVLQLLPDAKRHLLLTVLLYRYGIVQPLTTVPYGTFNNQYLTVGTGIY